MEVVRLPVECLDLKKRPLFVGILEAVGIREMGCSSGPAEEDVFNSALALDAAVDELESRENRSETLVLRFTGVGRGKFDCIGSLCGACDVANLAGEGEEVFDGCSG